MRKHPQTISPTEGSEFPLAMEVSDHRSIVDFEKETIQRVLDDCNWDIKIASQRLGMSLYRLRSKIKSYGL